MNCRTAFWVLTVTWLLTACGGGGGDGGADNTQLDVLARFEAAAVSSSYYSLSSRYPTTGQPAVDGVDYFHRTRFNWRASPTIAQQDTRPQVENLASTVGSLPALQQGFQRQVVAGVVRTRTAGDRTSASWQNGRLVLSTYAADQVTQMSADAITEWSVALPLSGSMAASPDEVRAATPVLTRTAHTLFDLSRSWQAGSAYIKRRRVSATEDVHVLDWDGIQTYTDTPTPFPGPATTIESLFALFPAGNLLGGRVTQLSDGDILLVQGVRLWMLRTPMASSARPTPTYQAFLELGGKIYFAEYIRSGTPERQISALDGTVLLDYSVRWNLAATESFRLALNY